MSPQEVNAEILRSHFQIKPEFSAHSGTFISDMCDKVFRLVPKPSVSGPTCEEREPCEFCFDTGEYISRGYDGSEMNEERCGCPAGKVKP